MRPHASLRRHARRVGPGLLAVLASWAWWFNTQERTLVVPLRWLTWLLVVRTVLVAARVTTRWRARPRALRRDLPRAVIPVGLTVLCCVLFPRVMLGLETLAGWDFPVHSWHTHVLANQLFPSLRGWTFDQAFGWAEGDDYSLVAYLPAALLHLFTFKTVGVEAAVAIEVAVVTAGLPIVVALFLGQRVPTVVALLGGVAVLLDPGSFHQLGTAPLLVFGMWPVRLSLGLSVAAMWAADRYVQSPSSRRLWAAVVCTFLAAQSHAVGITYVGAALLLWWIVSSQQRPGKRAWLLLASGIMGALLTTGWLAVPFLALKDLQLSLGESVELLKTFGDHLAYLGFLDRLTPFEMALGLVGTVLLIKRAPLAARLALASWAVAALWLSADVLRAVFPTSQQDVVERMQWTRYFFFARATLLFAGGCAVAWGLAWAARWWLHPRRNFIHVLFATGTLALLGNAYDEGWRALFPRSALFRAMATPTVLDLPYARPLEEAAQWLKQRATEDTLLVVDVPIRNEPSAHLASWIAQRTGIPVVARKDQGTFHFRDVGMRQGTFAYGELAAAGATHWLSVGPAGAEASPLHEVLTLPCDVHLYEVPRPSGDQRVESNVPVTITSWTADRVAFSGPPQGFEVSLRMRWHPRWKVKAGDGVVVERAAFRAGSRPSFMHLVVPPGVTEVVLGCGPPDGAWSGYAVTALGLAVLAFTRRAARSHFG